MVSFTKVLFAAGTAAALAIQERTVAQVKATLVTVDTDTNNLNTAIGKIQTSADAGNAQKVEQTLEKDIDAATAQANKESVASSTDSKSILSYVTGTLTPDIKAALDTTVGKKATLTSVGYAGIVKSDLTTLQSKAKTLGAALKKVASSDQQTAAQNAINTIDSLFSSAIAKF